MNNDSYVIICNYLDNCQAGLIKNKTGFAEPKNIKRVFI